MINEIRQEYGVHPFQVGQWKKEIQDQAGTLFTGKRGPKSVAEHSAPDRLYAEGGRLKMELDWFKKVWVLLAMTRYDWISPSMSLAVSRQCVLAGVSRTTRHARQKPKVVSTNDLALHSLIDEEYTRHPFYGSCKMVVHLERCGHTVNRKRVQLLMRALGLVGMAHGPNTSRAQPQHKAYLYLLRGVEG